MHPCCSRADAPAPAAVTVGPPRRSWIRRFAALIEWAIPITTLALIPKCPACVAAYILLFSGIGLSIHAAAAMRWTLIALCISTLAYLLLRAGRRALRLLV